MQPKDFFKKTFVFAFTFIVVYKFVGLAMNKFEGFDAAEAGKIVGVALITALILGGINYYAKFDFFTKKSDRNKNNG